jgi:predicted DNA-binding protein YlxM (UPF0122 family)
MFDEKTLRKLYLEDELSIRSIATRTHVSVRTVYDALLRYRIPRRPAGSRTTSRQATGLRIDEATLRQLYLNELRSIRAIAELAHVSSRTIFDALVGYGIPRRTAGYRRPTRVLISTRNGSLDAPMLSHMYVEESRSIAAIAEASQCSESCIRRALLRSGITLRRRGRQRRMAGGEPEGAFNAAGATDT